VSKIKFDADFWLDFDKIFRIGGTLTETYIDFILCPPVHKKCSQGLNFVPLDYANSVLRAALSVDVSDLRSINSK